MLFAGSGQLVLVVVGVRRRQRAGDVRLPVCWGMRGLHSRGVEWRVSTGVAAFAVDGVAPAGRVRAMDVDSVVVPGVQGPALRRARSLLAALCERPGLEALPAIEALAVLDGARPPLPPVDELPADEVGAVTVAQAQDALVDAARGAADAGEAARIAQAGLSLRSPVA